MLNMAFVRFFLLEGRKENTWGSMTTCTCLLYVYCGFVNTASKQGWFFAMAKSIFAKTAEKTVKTGNNRQKVLVQETA